MRRAKCECGYRETVGSMFPPCDACEKCGTAPGTLGPAEPHQFSKRYDQRTGEPFNFCFNCGKKQTIVEESEPEATE